MKQTRNLLVAGAIALVAGVFSACGGGSGAGSNIPTDGILGEVPQVVAKYVPELEKIREVIFSNASGEEKDKARAEFDALDKEWKEKVNAALNNIGDKEIPIEAAEGVNIRPDANLKLVKGRKLGGLEVTVNFETEASLTDFVKIEDFKYEMVAYDAEGNPLGVKRGVIQLDPDAIKDMFKINGYNKDSKMTITFWAGHIEENPEGWAKLAKVVIMDERSDAYKQAEEQVKANKETAK
ncbi:MAG: hypothetical protein IJV17_04160 [Prevotella sp.]|nr:hypothetical protein [Prevotella sp.]